MSFQRIPRMLLISWKNKRSGFTRRARWYAQDSDNLGVNVRIALEDTDEGSQNHFPPDREAAQKLWDDFKAGKVDIYGKPAETVG